MDDKDAVGEGLATLASSSSDVLKGFLGLLSAGIDNPYFVIIIIVVMLCAYIVFKISKPNSSMAEVAKESTSTTEKVSLKQSDLLSDAICKITDLSANVIDILRSHSKVQEDTTVVLSKILKTQEEHGELISSIKCLKDKED
jgi:nucleoside permease NupC